MKSSISAVRTAFNNTITGLGYAVYDRDRNAKDYPHIVVGEQTEAQDGDQGAYGQIATINVEIYNGWVSDYGERTTSDDIVNAVLFAVLTKPASLNIVGFDMPMLVIDNILTSTEKTKTHTIVTTVLRFRMHLFENLESPVTLAIRKTADIELPFTGENNYMHFYINDLTAVWSITWTDNQGPQSVLSGQGISPIFRANFINNGDDQPVDIMVSQWGNELDVMLYWRVYVTVPDDSSYFTLTVNNSISETITLNY